MQPFSAVAPVRSDWMDGAYIPLFGAAFAFADYIRLFINYTILILIYTACQIIIGETFGSSSS